MSTDPKLIEFVKKNIYSDYNITDLKSNLGRTNKQLIRDSFEMLKSTIKLYDKNVQDSLIIYNTIQFIILLCSKEIFSESEIEINKERVRRVKKLLLQYINDNEINAFSYDLLDIITDKVIDSTQLKKLIMALINRQEDIYIIKRFISLNCTIITDSTELFDFVFNKTIKALKEDNRDVYYYISLLKLFHNSKINKDNYITRLNKFGKDIITEEIYNILDGDNIPYNCDKIFDKYGIVKDPAISLIKPKDYLRSNEKIITIDPKNTYLKDDAISIKEDGNKFIVRIYITNPTGIIRKGSRADKDACNNFQSMYLPKRKIRMLNEKVEANVSLTKGRPRDVFILETVINDSGELIDYYLLKDTVVISDNLSYKYADKILQTAKKDDELYFLNKLRDLANALKKNNNKKTEYWKLKDELKENETERTESELLISEYMILYGRLIATIAKDEGIPYIYRGKDEEYISTLMKEMGIDIDKRTQKLLSNLYLDSKYSSKPIFHHGLGFECYSHSTDPGRRYVDLYNQYLMNDYYFNRHSKKNFDYDNLDLMIEYFNKRSRELSLMQTEYIKSLYLNK